jgi:hypothetical protein
MVRLPDQRSADMLPTFFPVIVFSLFALTSSTRRIHRSSREYTYSITLGVKVLVSLSDGLAGNAFPLYNTLAVRKRPAGSNEPVCAPGQSYYAFLDRIGEAGL